MFGAVSFKKRYLPTAPYDKRKDLFMNALEIPEDKCEKYRKTITPDN